MALAAIAVIAALAYLISLSGPYASLRAAIKPMPVLLLALCFCYKSSRYTTWVVIGLIVSAFGDVYLAVGDSFFLYGLGAFLIAHVCYMKAFGWRVTRKQVVGLFPFLVWSGLMAWILLPHTGQLKLPVMAYILVICLMMWRATMRWIVTRDAATMRAFLGALLFGVSDTLLSCQLFLDVGWASPYAVITTYWLAQALIASSMIGATAD